MTNRQSGFLAATPLRFDAPRLSRRRALAAGGVALASTWLGSHVQAQEATPGMASAGQFSPERQLALTEIVLAALAATNTPGALVAVWYPGQGSWSMAAGISDLTTASPAHLDDHFRIASITKTFVATVALQLVEEGKLSLDDVLATFITGIPNGEAITIRQLLDMTSGIYNYVFDPVISVDYVRDPLTSFTPQHVVEIVRAHGKADFAPGEKIVYCDTNYIFLGLIIEQVTGNTIAEEITARIVGPLGLTQTSFATTPELPEPYLRGYMAEAAAGPLRDVSLSNPTIAWAAGAMVSTLNDLRTWVGALVSGALLSPELQAERIAVGIISTTPIQVGYGMGILELGGLLGHNGGILGYGSWMMQEPESGATIIVVCNSSNVAGGPAGDIIFADVAKLFFPERGFSGTHS